MSGHILTLFRLLSLFLMVQQILSNVINTDLPDINLVEWVDSKVWTQAKHRLLKADMCGHMPGAKLLTLKHKYKQCSVISGDAV